jgi:hypothetical protein
MCEQANTIGLANFIKSKADEVKEIVRNWGLEIRKPPDPDPPSKKKDPAALLRLQSGYLFSEANETIALLPLRASEDALAKTKLQVCSRKVRNYNQNKTGIAHSAILIHPSVDFGILPPEDFIAIPFPAFPAEKLEKSDCSKAPQTERHNVA